MAGTTGGSNGNGNSGKTASNGKGSSASASVIKQPLVVQYPVNSVWEFTLQPNQDTISGRVYCTDETSQIVVLQKALIHTTLACEIQMVNVASIVQAKALPESEETQEVAPLSQPLPKIQKKALEERERRSIRLAEDSFKHINQKVRVGISFVASLLQSHQVFCVRSGPLKVHPTALMDYVLASSLTYLSLLYAYLLLFVFISMTKGNTGRTGCL
jgi:hypothetical protein